MFRMIQVWCKNKFVKVCKKCSKRSKKTQNVVIRPQFSGSPAPLPIRSSSRCDIARRAGSSPFVRISPHSNNNNDC